MKKRSGLFLFILFFAHRNEPGIFTESRFTPRYHIAVFLPLYLDSAFDASGNYRFDQNFPKYLNPGLEFYEGLQLAVDSLKKKVLPLDITVYDTRSTISTIQQMLEDTFIFQNAADFGACYIPGTADPGQCSQKDGSFPLSM